MIEYKKEILINKNRLDVIAKYIYVSAYVTKHNYEYAKRLYENTILVTTKGAVIEPDHFNTKHNMTGYVSEFNHLIDSILENGFDESISAGNVGAHRAACILRFGGDTFCADEKAFDTYGTEKDLRFDKKFFMNNDFRYEYLCTILETFNELSQSEKLEIPEKKKGRTISGLKRIKVTLKYKARRIAILIMHYLGYIKPLRKLYPNFKYYPR